MGSCLSACVNLATYCHAKYIDWRWDSQDDMIDLEMVCRPTNNTKSRSIHAAIIDQHLTEVRRILTEDEEAKTVVNLSGETALHSACKLGYKAVIEELLQCGCSACIRTDLGTPIHCLIQSVKSSYMKHEEAVYFIYKLVDKGCDINGVDRGEKTALFCASENGNLPCLEALIHLGASVNCKVR